MNKKNKKSKRPKPGEAILIKTIRGEDLMRKFIEMADPTIIEITLDQLIASGNMIDAAEAVEVDDIPIVISQTVWEIFEEIPDLDRTERIRQIVAWTDKCIMANCDGDDKQGYILKSPARYYQPLPGGNVEIIIDISPGKYKGKVYEEIITVMHAHDD